MVVPEVLLSGDHAKIARWRREQSLLRTALGRPDLLEAEDVALTDAERDLIEDALHHDPEDK
jgi:tRNA (guanine37-N1)-methyltransferase